MKITGTSNVSSNSSTASRPELPSASWISARIWPGRFFLAMATASGDPDHAMAEALQQAFEIKGYDKDIGGDVGGELASGLLD